MFVYFAEGTHRTVPDELRYAFEGSKNISFRGANDGPGSVPGTVIAHASVEQVGYFRDQQRWRRVPGTRCFVGHSLDDALPLAEDLRRSKMLRGHTVELGGQQWTVPVARSWNDECRWTIELPRLVELSDDGEWVYAGVVPRYSRLWEIGERWFDCVFDRGEKDEQGNIAAPLQPDEAFSLAAEVLSFNYRVSAVELSMLGAFESGSYADVLDLVIDWPRLAVLMESLGDKKKGDSAAA